MSKTKTANHDVMCAESNAQLLAVARDALRQIDPRSDPANGERIILDQIRRHVEYLQSFECKAGDMVL